LKKIIVIDIKIGKTVITVSLAAKPAKQCGPYITENDARGPIAGYCK